MKRHFVLFILLLTGRAAFSSGFNEPELRMSARTFSIVPKVGTPTGSRIDHPLEAVYGDLKSTVYLFRQGDKTLCLLTSSLGIESGQLHDACVDILSRTLHIAPEAVVCGGSHNHTVPIVYTDPNKKPAAGSPELLAWELGMEYEKKLKAAAEELTGALVPVEVAWGKAEENRITYNRHGIRVDGRPYFVREEDRVQEEGEGYRGLIDPDAVVVLFQGRDGKPVAGLTFFTGHPVVAYNPEKMFSFGQFPQVACEILSDHLGHIPVGFVQGCAGDINGKYMLTGTIEQARQCGEYLGQTFLLAARKLHSSKRGGMEWSREKVYVPSAPLPDARSLQTDLDSIDAFIKRGNAGDENTMECVGMNFPKALTPPYRAKLVDLVRPWYVWALDQYKTNNIRNVPTTRPLTIVVARFGDVGYVGLPFEPFVNIGLKMKREANLPIVLSCGYTDGSMGYIPDAASAAGKEYMSGFYRYVGNIPPYKAPAGEECSRVAVEKLDQMAK